MSCDDVSPAPRRRESSVSGRYGRSFALMRSPLYAGNSLDIWIIAERNALSLPSSSSTMLEAERRPTFLASLHGKAETRNRQHRHCKQNEQARNHRRFRDGGDRESGDRPREQRRRGQIASASSIPGAAEQSAGTVPRTIVTTPLLPPNRTANSSASATCPFSASSTTTATTSATARRCRSSASEARPIANSSRRPATCIGRRTFRPILRGEGQALPCRR